MWLVSGGDPAGDQHRVEMAAHLIGARVGPVVAGRLLAERVLDGDEVELPVLGFGREAGPVGGGEQLIRGSARLAPGGRMPAGPVQRDSEMQRGIVGHISQSKQARRESLCFRSN
jgi:hypothetical protein